MQLFQPSLCSRPWLSRDARKGNSREKVGSDIHDLVRLVQECDFDAVDHAISEAGDELREWGWEHVGEVVLSAPVQDLRYTYARLRRLARSTDAEMLTEDDLAAVAELGRVLLD